MASDGLRPIHAADYTTMTAAEIQETSNTLNTEVKERLEDRTSVASYDYVQEKFRYYGIGALQRGLDNGLDRLAPGQRLLPQGVFLSLYTISHRLVQRDDDAAPRFLQFFRNTVDEYLRTRVLYSLGAKRDVQLLSEFHRRWENHKVFTEWMRRLFFFIDRSDLIKSSGKPTLTSVSHKLFKTVIFDSRKDALRGTIQDQIMLDRRGEAVERSQTRSVVELFSVMGIADTETQFKDQKHVLTRTREAASSENEVYRLDFEIPFIANTVEYYRGVSDTWMSEDPVPTYLIKVEAALDQERRILDMYTHPSTGPKLNRELTVVLLQSRQAALLEKEGSGIAVLLRDDKVDDLRRMYTLFSRWDGGVEPMARALREYVESVGQELLQRRVTRLASEEGKKVEAHDPVFVRDLIGLHRKYAVLIETHFANNPAFQKALQDAFKVIVNANARGEDDVHPNAELLAAYADMVLKGKQGEEKLTEEQIHTSLKECQTLFSHLHDKDYFQEFYRNNLARRLLQNRSHSFEAEREMISLLKSAEGASFTQKFEGMLTDFLNPDRTVADYRTTFGAWMRTKVDEDVKAGRAPRDAFDFEVRVLCSGYWPASYDSSSVALPVSLREAVDHYSAAYNTAHSSGRRLTFSHAEGSMTIRAWFSEKPDDWKELMCMPLQAALLLQFNERTESSVKDLASLVGMSDDDAMRLLHPLVFAPVCKVLNKKTGGPADKRFAPTDVLVFNDKFKHPLKRLNVPFIALREKKVAGPGADDLQRGYILDAAITRIMKARRTLKFDALIGEVQRQVRLFNPDVRQVKARIDKLIEGNFLERSETDRAELNYVA